MAKPKVRPNLESLTMFQILTSLKPAQIWTILVIVFGLLSGSFGLGYKLKSSIAESEIAKYESELTTFQEKTKQFRGLQTKERFLALYLRYLIAKDVHARSAMEETKKSVDEAASHFKSYIDKLLERGEEVADEIDLRGLFIGKSGKKTDVTVKFGYDGSVWPLLGEFGFYAKAK